MHHTFDSASATGDKKDLEHRKGEVVEVTTNVHKENSNSKGPIHIDNKDVVDSGT